MRTLVAIGGFLLTGLSIIMIVFFVQAALRDRRKVADLVTEQTSHNSRRLWLLIFLAVLYSNLLRYLPTLTGMPLVDGSLGVALGLYTCAHPAANAVNLLFFEQTILHRLSEWAVIRWLALNLVVLLAGWLVLFIGIIRLVGSRS